MKCQALFYLKKKKYIYIYKMLSAAAALWFKLIPINSVPENPLPLIDPE